MALRLWYFSQYASPANQPSILSTSVDDDEVFHAMPIHQQNQQHNHHQNHQNTPPPPTSFSNQLYMDGEEASEVSESMGQPPQNQTPTTTSPNLTVSAKTPTTVGTC